MSDRPEWVVNTIRKGRWQLTVGKSKFSDGLIYSIQMGKRDPKSLNGWKSEYLKGISRKSLDDLIECLNDFRTWELKSK